MHNAHNTPPISATKSALQYLDRLIELDASAIGVSVTVVRDIGGCAGSKYDVSYLYNTSAKYIYLLADTNSFQLQTGISDEILSVFNRSVYNLERKFIISVKHSQMLMMFRTVIDFDDDIVHGERLIFKNPNVTSQCGCGLSVNFDES